VVVVVVIVGCMLFVIFMIVVVGSMFVVIVVMGGVVVVIFMIIIVRGMFFMIVVVGRVIVVMVMLVFVVIVMLSGVFFGRVLRLGVRPLLFENGLRFLAARLKAAAGVPKGEQIVALNERFRAVAIGEEIAERCGEEQLNAAAFNGDVEHALAVHMCTGGLCGFELRRA
ncbi:MAG: hypothetical protein AAGE43_11910, partial [Pseudomonadota bacterium]